MSWHTVSNKPPPLNKFVFVLNKNKKRLMRCKFQIHNKNNDHLENSNKLNNGDYFWRNGTGNWALVEDFPYWLTHDELVRLITEKEEETLNRFELLDIERTE